jgi:hypothetical protein
VLFLDNSTLTDGDYHVPLYFLIVSCNFLFPNLGKRCILQMKSGIEIGIYEQGDVIDLKTGKVVDLEKFMKKENS